LHNNYSVVNLSIFDYSEKAITLTHSHDFSAGYCLKIANYMLYLAIVNFWLDGRTLLCQFSCTPAVQITAEFVRQIQTSLKMACHI